MSSICVNDAGQIIVTCPYECRDAVKAAGGKWDAVLKKWTLAFTPDTVESLIDTLPNPQVHPDVEKILIETIEREKKLKRIRAMSKVDHPVCLKVPGLNGSLYNYQKLGVMFALANGHGVLVADEMGLGKTLQAIATALYLKSKGEVKQCLIVVPPSLKFNWAIEIEKWTNESYVVIDGTPDERVAQWLKKNVFFYVVNFELLLEDLFGGRDYKPKKNETLQQKADREARKAKAQRRAKILTPVRERLWDFVAVDEAQALKNATSKRSRNVRSLRCKFRMALTGTPLDGRLEELHSVMEFVCPGLLGSRTRFLQRHAETDFWGKVVKYRRIGEVRKKIQPHFVRRLKKDVLDDLPDKLYSNRMVELTPAEKKVYQALAENGHAATEDAAALVSIIRCKQFCDDPYLLADALESAELEEPVDPKEIKKLRKLTRSKLEALREVLQEVVIDNAHKVLVFSQYAEMVKVLMKLFDEMGLKYLCIWGDTDKKLRADYQKQFNEDKTIDIMVGTEAMSTGLNFTAADYVINYDDNWAPAYMAQREDRAHRIVQKNVVTVINFICVDTIEERIRTVLYQKSKISAQALGDEIDEMVLKRLGPQETAKLL
jgi:SNF2 family DNA or RNA helicase